MTDETTTRGANDRNRINVREEHEVRHWTETLGVTRERLEAAVNVVGVSADAVRLRLHK